MEIEKQIINCRLCGDYPKPNCNSLKEGNSTIMVIGESPAKNGWLVSGKAFYDINGKVQGTGKVLNRLLNLCNLTIDDIYFTECCKCHIADRTQLERCSKNCKDFLIKQIEKSNCEIILTMGVFATQIVLDAKIKKFKDYVGQSFEIFFNKKLKTVIPIYHTSPVNPLGYKGNIKIFEELQNDNCKRNK